jgi:peptidoglycan hydrolase CwlO-like protein
LFLFKEFQMAEIKVYYHSIPKSGFIDALGERHVFEPHGKLGRLVTDNEDLQKELDAAVARRTGIMADHAAGADESARAALRSAQQETLEAAQAEAKRIAEATAAALKTVEEAPPAEQSAIEAARKRIEANKAAELTAAQ